MPERELPVRTVGKWLLIVVLTVLILALLIIVFEVVRLLVDPGHRA